MEEQQLGFTSTMAAYREANGLSSFKIGRIALEHKDRYSIKTEKEEYEAELIGNLRFNAEDRYDLPAVGDWVAFQEYDAQKALIHAVYPRFSILERKSVGGHGTVQIIATNIDFGLVVQAVDRDFNLNRLDRYNTVCNTANVHPIIVLSKSDLVSSDKLKQLLSSVRERHPSLTALAVHSGEQGYSTLEPLLKSAKTYCLLGSSGVGKSTILNALYKNSKMKTSPISQSVNKGKHTTSHRELIVLPNGAIVVDNPGMREIGITHAASGLEATFDWLQELSLQCKYKDCTHQQEAGCAVLEAVADGLVPEEAYANYLKMEREKRHFESDVLERKKKDKSLGKAIKYIQKQKSKNKF